MKSVELILKYKEEKGIDFRTLAEKTKKSHAYWWILLKRDQRTPTIQNAIQIVEALDLNEEERNTVLNLVFKERCLEHLEKQGFTKHVPTEEIRIFIKFLKEWKPEMGKPPEIGKAEIGKPRIRPNLKLKARIIEQYGSQSDFALVAEVDHTLVSAVIHNRRKLAGTEKHRWAKLLKAEPDEIWP